MKKADYNSIYSNKKYIEIAQSNALGSNYYFTLTLQVSLAPDFILRVILAVPFFLPVTLPFELTVATF